MSTTHPTIKEEDRRCRRSRRLIDHIARLVDGVTAAARYGNGDEGPYTNGPFVVGSTCEEDRLFRNARSVNYGASTAQPRSNVGTVANCYRGHGRGEDREIAGVKPAEVTTARLVRDERGWLRLTG